MSVVASYRVRCVGGGWLDPGRPLACLGVSSRFATDVQAFVAARDAHWAYDVVTHEHRCPAHQTGPGHVHFYKKTLVGWPEGPDGETGAIKACACGAAIIESEGTAT